MPLTMLGVDSRVRLKSTGEMYVVDSMHLRQDTTYLTLSKYGHLAGGFHSPSETFEVKRGDVILLKQVTDWQPDE